MSAIQQLLTEHIGIWTGADAAKRTGRGRASSNAGSVYGIRKLRELIYELAATGLLVNQENEFTAQELLLGDVSDFVMGQAPPGNECNTNGQGTVFVKTGEFGVLYPEVKEWTTKPLKFAKKGDVLICVVGATIGKLNLGIDCAIGRSVAAIRPNKKILTEYLYLVLVPFTIRLRDNSRGSAQPVIGKTELSAVKIRVASLDEQRRIVAKVDELMALCDQLEAQHNNAIEAHEEIVNVLLQALTQSADAPAFADNWQRIAAHFDTLFTTETSIDALKQTLLQLAVMGKLVPQGVNDEPASELLKKIRAEKDTLIKTGKIKKDKPLAEITEEEKPFELPGGWEWARFPELGEFARGKSKHRPRNDPKLFNPGVFPLVQTGEVARAGSLIEEFHSKYSEIGLAQSKMWLAGTLCITIAANIADSALLGFDACFPDSVVGFSPCKPLSDARYFLYFMKTARENLLKFAPATAQKNINLEILESVLIPVPPLKEMVRIVVKVDELMALCDQLKTRIGEAGRLQQKIADLVVEGAVA